MRRRLVLMGVAALAAAGQPATKPQASAHLNSGRLPQFAEGYSQVLGERLRKPGRERMTLSGTLSNPSGSATTVALTWELPGRFRLDRAGAGAIIGHSFGTAAPAGQTAVNESDSDLVESLFQDLPETFLYNVANGQGVRVLGQKFRLESGRNPNYTGPYFDVIDTSARLDSRNGSPRREKRYYFDSQSGLLQRVLYRVQRQGQAVEVETRFSEWTKTGTESAPGQIERRENGTVKATFRLRSATYAPQAADGLFERP